MNKDIKPQNLHLHCRTCLCALATGLKYEINGIVPLTLLKLFKKSTKQTKNKLYPDSICEQCFECLKNFHEFQIKAKESTEYLNELLDSYTPSQELEEENDAYKSTDESESEASFSKAEIFDDDLSDSEKGDDPLQCASSENKTKEALEKDESNFESVLVKIELKETDETLNLDNIDADEIKDVPLLDSTKEKKTSSPKKQKKEIICKICLKTFNTNSARKSHVRDNHRDRPLFECEQCDRKFKKKTRLKNHMNEDHGENPIEIVCKFGCGKVFRRLQSASNHYRLKHAKQELSESENKEGIVLHENEMKTEDNITPSKKIKTKISDEEQSDSEKEEDEMKKLPDISKTTCPICHKIFSNTTALRKHKNLHEDVRPFQCDQCGRGFNCKSRMEKHVREIHAENPVMIECKFGCGKSFKSSDSAGNHYRRYHTGDGERIYEAPCICEDCGRTFKSITRLRQHSYQHRPVEDRPFHCKLCNKRYVFKKTYNEHMLRHTGIKNFECPVCGLKKTTKQELRNHMKYHTDELKVPCPICSKIFGNPPNLRRHIQLVHEGVKNFKCRYCEECFGKAETLKHHEMRHTGEKPHKCEICDRSFIQLVALKTHMKTHNKLPRMSKANRQAEIPPSALYEPNASMEISEGTL